MHSQELLCIYCTTGKLGLDSETSQEAVPASVSNDWHSGFNPQHNHLSAADNATYSKSSLGKYKCIVILSIYLSRISIVLTIGRDYTKTLVVCLIMQITERTSFVAHTYTHARQPTWLNYTNSSFIQIAKVSLSMRTTHYFVCVSPAEIVLED